MTSMQRTMLGRLGSVGTRAVLLALCGAALSVTPVLAQDNSGPPQGGMGRGMGRGPGGAGGRGNPARMEERQLEMMTKQLSLSKDQVGQIKGIYADSDVQLKALRDDTSTAREDKRGRMMSLMQERQSKVRGVLTEDQKAKLDAMQAKMRERRGEHGPRNGGPPPPPPGM